MDPLTIAILDRVVQWLVLPLLVGYVYLSRQVTTQDKEILRILTILEERNKIRDEDLARNQNSVNKLFGAIEKLTDRLDSFITSFEDRHK